MLDRRRRALLLTMATACALLRPRPGRGAPPPEAAAADDALRRIMERVRAGPRPVAEDDRRRLLEAGEQQLLQGDAQRAADLFEQAGFVRHAADAELGLVRSWMQLGQYRRALAFAAHTAGAHPDVSAGAAMYAWLLFVGGQGGAARALLNRARLRASDDPLLAALDPLLGAEAPVPTGTLLQLPGRLAPVEGAPSPGQPGANSRTCACAILGPDGAHALTALQPLRDTAHLRVRSALGEQAAAQLIHGDEATGTGVLRLHPPLGQGRAPAAAARAPFPGSPAFAVRYAVPAPQPAWPLLSVGFIGAPAAQPGLVHADTSLGALPPGAAVFDAYGALTGIGIGAATDPQPRIVPAARLSALAPLLPLPAPDRVPARVAVDEIYERALGCMLQVLA